MLKATLDSQQQHWDKTFAQYCEMFGETPSLPALASINIFKSSGVRSVMELGAGQGRDTLFFARSGLAVRALDYAQSALDAIVQKAKCAGLSNLVNTTRHDVRQPLPFADNTLDACFSHMLFCMALTNKELGFLSAEIRRVLKPGGLCIYTARHTGDAHCGSGEYLGESLYKNAGFIVHFFNTDMVGRLAEGYETLGVEEFEEGTLPRKLFRVAMKKM